MGVNVKRGGSYAAALGVSAKAGGVYMPAVPYVKSGGLYVPQGLFPVDANFLLGAMPAGWALARASIGTRNNSSGALVTESANVARFDYDPATLVPRGVLVEAAATNAIRNNTMVGASAGVPPTNWTGWGSASGATIAVVGAGVESGVAYLDARVSGTYTGATGNVFILSFESNVATANGVVNTVSSFLTLQAGALSGATLRLRQAIYDSASSILANAESADLAVAAGSIVASRYQFLRSEVLANAAFVRPFVRVALVNGASYDFTFRIGMPQLERDSLSSVIATATAAVTRAADILTTTLPSASDVLVQDRNGAEWRLAVPSGAYTASPRAGQTAIARIRAVPTGYYSASQRAAIAAANSLI